MFNNKNLKILIDKLNLLRDKTLLELSNSYDLKISLGKNKRNLILKKYLDLFFNNNSNKFLKDNNISLRSIFYNFDKHELKEHIQLISLTLDDLKQDNFKKTSLYNLLKNKIFLFVLFDNNKNDKSEFVKEICYFKFSDENLKNAEKVFFHTKKIFTNGGAKTFSNNKIKYNFIKSSNKLSFHLRPHAKNSYDTYTTFANEKIIKQSFWLNKEEFIKKIKMFLLSNNISENKNFKNTTFDITIDKNYENILKSINMEFSNQFYTLDEIFNWFEKKFEIKSKNLINFFLKTNNFEISNNIVSKKISNSEYAKTNCETFFKNIENYDNEIINKIKDYVGDNYFNYYYLKNKTQICNKLRIDFTNFDKKLIKNKNIYFFKLCNVKIFNFVKSKSRSNLFIKSFLTNKKEIYINEFVDTLKNKYNLVISKTKLIKLCENNLYYNKKFDKIFLNKEICIEKIESL
ncbi:hypothetical protein [Mycoplasmoides pirum]|uniref:hypothetical protein n=1 Tax=Mycoplasmoides pirum TaxID=2122 RepID=UPI0004859255|nr:hypothetical protein [Mycoplasmoides pirum]